MHRSGVTRECGKALRLLEASSKYCNTWLLCVARDKPASDKKGTGKQPKGNPSKALNRLLKYLLPIAGKRILVLFALAIVRTALSNRLARMQVLSLGLSLLLAVGEAVQNVLSVSKSRGSRRWSCLQARFARNWLWQG